MVFRQKLCESMSFKCEQNSSCFCILLAPFTPCYLYSPAYSPSLSSGKRLLTHKLTSLFWRNFHPKCTFKWILIINPNYDQHLISWHNKVIGLIPTMAKLCVNYWNAIWYEFSHLISSEISHLDWEFPPQFPNYLPINGNST